MQFSPAEYSLFRRTMPSAPSVSMPSIHAASCSICGVTGLFCCRMRSSIFAPGPCLACPLPGPPLPAWAEEPRPLGPAGPPLPLPGAPAEDKAGACGAPLPPLPLPAAAAAELLLAPLAEALLS